MSAAQPKPRGRLTTSEKCRQAREHLGLSQAALAELLRIDRMTVIRVETRQQPTGPYQLVLEALVSGWRPSRVRLPIDGGQTLLPLSDRTALVELVARTLKPHLFDERLSPGDRNSLGAAICREHILEQAQRVVDALCRENAGAICCGPKAEDAETAIDAWNTRTPTVTDETVERVARALYEAAQAENGNHSALPWHIVKDGETGGKWLSYARAAIEAMQEMHDAR